MIRAALLGGAIACAACADRLPGKVLATGAARGLHASASGESAAFLLDAAHPDDRAVPDDLYLGDLWLSRGGAPARKAGSGVPSSDGASAFEPQGEALAFLASYRFRAGEGELWVALPGAEPKRLAAAAGAFAWSPRGGLLAFAAGGRLHVVRVRDGKELGPGADRVQTFAWSSDGAHLAARGPSSGGGRVALLAAGAFAPAEVASASSDLAFAPDGVLAVLGPAQGRGGDRALTLVDPATLQKRDLGRATAFSFAPSGAQVALLSTAKNPGEAFGDLVRVSLAPGTAPLELGSKVSDFRWSPEGDLVYLAQYDLRSRAGTLFALPKDKAEPQKIADRVQSFSVQGRRALYLVQQPQKTDFKIELWTTSLGAPASAPPASGGAPAPQARRVDEGVYGYQLSRDGALLYWKSRCSGLRSCALLRAPADGSSQSVVLAPAVAGFDLSGNGARVLVAQVHRGTRGLDLRVLDALGPPPEAPPRPIAEDVDPGARFLDSEGHRVLAALSGEKKGVLRLEVP